MTNMHILYFTFCGIKSVQDSDSQQEWSGIKILFYRFHSFTISEILPRQDFKGKGHYGKVKSRSYHDITHLHLLNNVLTKYQLPTP